MSANGRESKDDPQFLCGVAVSVYQNSGGSNQFSGKSAAAVVWKDQLYAKHPDQQDNIYIYVVCTGDPNSNWAWYEKQKMVAVDLKLSLSSGDTLVLTLRIMMAQWCTHHGTDWASLL